MDPQLSEPGEDTSAKPRVKPNLAIAAARRRQPRGDAPAGDVVGNTLLRVAVVILSSINAVMWEVYTEAPVMASLWAAIAVGFVGWMIYDKRHR